MMNNNALPDANHDACQRHIIITGGSSGIGRALALRLTAQGTCLSLIARGQKRLESVRDELLAAGSETVSIFIADVSERAACEQAIHAAIEANGAVDLLVTSAGIAQPGYFEEVETTVFERTMAVNYFGTLYAIRAALASLRSRQESRIVMISSGAGLIGLFGYTPYAPTKFALRGLAESLRGELKQQGVGLSIVYPPDTDTPQLAFENRSKPEETKRITGTAKMWSADAVAKVIVRGIESKKFSITPGWEMTWLGRLHSLIGRPLQAYFDFLARETK